MSSDLPISEQDQIAACEIAAHREDPRDFRLSTHGAALRAAAKTLRDAEPLVREIHDQLKRGHDTVDHGLLGNLHCVVDTLADDVWS